MELSPSWEAVSCSATQEFPSILCSPKFHCRVHKGPPLFRILSQINPVHCTSKYLSKIHSNIILPHLVLLSGLFPSGFPTKIIFLLVRQFIQRIRPSLRPCKTFRNNMLSYGEGLLFLRPTPKQEDHPLSSVRDFLFSIFAATLHIWRPSFPPATWGLAVP
jgi:hypothetical protein